MTDRMVSLETEEGTYSYSWSRFRYMNSFGELAVIGGDKIGIYLPVRAVGTAEDVAELKRFVRECVDRERHGTLDIEAFRKEYEEKTAFCYCFSRTREELAEEYADVLPRPFFSKEYWNWRVALRWLLVLAVTAFFCGLTRNRAVWMGMGVLYLLFGARMVWQSRFEARKRYFLRNNGEKMNRGLAGECLFAFDEMGLRAVQPDMAHTIVWKNIRRVKKGRNYLGFQLRTGGYLVLPEKVFDGAGEERRLLEYCERRIRKGQEG